MRIDAKISPVEIDTEAIFEIGMLSCEPPMRRGLIRDTRSGATSMRVGKIRFPAVSRLAVKTRAADIARSIGRDCPLFLIKSRTSRLDKKKGTVPVYRSTNPTSTVKKTRTGTPFIVAGR